MEHEQAIKLTAEELGIDESEVASALKVAALHGKHGQRIKERRRRAGAQALNKRRLEESKAKYPDQCFCIEEGLDPKHDEQRDEIIRQDREQSYSLIRIPTGQYYDDPVYRCSLCGKEWRVVIAMA